MTSRKEITRDLAITLAHEVFKCSRFEAHGYHSKSVAQKNLVGKTHYVDDDTLRWHKARVLACYAMDHGTLFALIESCALDMHNVKRGFRFVVFDLGGRVLGRAGLEETYPSKKAATKAMWEWVDAFDAVAHYKDRLSADIRRAERDIETMRKTIEALD